MMMAAGRRPRGAGLAGAQSDCDAAGLVLGAAAEQAETLLNNHLL